jgi:hypothetical protein
MSEWKGPLEDWRIDWATYGGPYIRYPAWPHPKNQASIAKLTFADPTPFEEKRRVASLIIDAPAVPDLVEALAGLLAEYTSMLRRLCWREADIEVCEIVKASRAALAKARVREVMPAPVPFPSPSGYRFFLVTGSDVTRCMHDVKLIDKCSACDALRAMRARAP